MERIMRGTPPMAFLPAKSFTFRVSQDNYIVRIPRRGSYKDIDPEFFTEEDGQFNILDENSRILYTPSITKVLFACKKYPELEFNQFFVPYSIVFEDEEVVLLGQIVDMVIPVENKEEAQ